MKITVEITSRPAAPFAGRTTEASITIADKKNEIVNTERKALIGAAQEAAVVLLDAVGAVEPKVEIREAKS